MYSQLNRRQRYGGTSRNADTPPSQSIAIIDGAVVKAHSDLIAAGETISAWKVSQSALRILKADSFESLGFYMQNVPSLNRIIITEAKVNSFIHCFVGVQKITTLYDLELAICESEGISRFEELELGPLLKHPLAVHYFSVGSNVAEIFKITSEQVVAYISILPRKKRKTTVDDILNFIAKRKKQSKENLCIRIQSLGMHMGYIIRGRRSEGALLKKCADGFDVKLILDDSENDNAQDSSLSSSQTATTSDSLAYDKFCTKFVGHKKHEKWAIGDVERAVIDNNVIDGHTWRFINICKQLCENANIDEAFVMMLDFYHEQMKQKKKIKALNSMITSYPYVGLLNVAVASIKFGFWDRLESRSQTILANTNLNTCAVDVNTDVEPAEKHVLVASIALEDVLKYANEYLMVSNHNIDSYPTKQLMCLREISKLECSLTSHFSVNDFETLGFGDIFTFLAEHISPLPTALQNCFTFSDKIDQPAVKACMSQHYLLEFISQVANSLLEHETLNKSTVSEFLKMQFPSAGLTMLNDDFAEDLLTNLSKNGDYNNSNIVLYSSTLSSCRGEKDIYTHVSTNDAIELLVNAPMLVDLTSWSFWDYKFAPSLGPLVGWLLSNVTTKELLCLVTQDGKVLRIDHTATVDSFLEAFLHGSSFETALKLVSLIGLYGGERKVPVSLLKCHVKNGFEVMLTVSSKNIASRFILDCLGYIPKEFRSFVAELLVSTFRSIIKDAHLVILSESKSKEDRMMIRELGLSLSIIEWFDDYCSCLSESNKPLENKLFSSKDEVILTLEVKQPIEDCKRDSVDDRCIPLILDSEKENIASNIIESIRIEEFGLDPNISVTESRILTKQHARLGRALHCLSQELYSQDSHFLLELVQNADDNVYPRNVEPTLTFILQEKSIIVLNNELGFAVENIRALCDVGNSTKKASGAGYIGKKGIGFKSVFRVTDAPEIHSNGFHIKFDLTEGPIGFVLPTIVPPCDIDLFTNIVSFDSTEQVNAPRYNTCIVLPLKSNLTEKSAVENITSMFSDLHPSLLLFLHRLQCIKFKNMLNDSFVIMRKQIVGNGLTNISIGNEILTWFVESTELQANGIRDDVKTTEISVAFALEVSNDGNYIPKLEQQNVFAFLPLRTYGLKFIIQGDFSLPSSREEVDGNSPWNQWLLSEFPNLFVNSERSFCKLFGLNNCLGKGVSIFLSYVPLVGEVHGFFASLPRMIISKLSTSNCLLLEGDNGKWVPPFRVLRNWNEQVRILLPDNLIQKHLGLGYLNKDIVLSDSLAKALGIQNYGPKILVQILSSFCHTKEGLKSMGLSWLSSCVNELYSMFLQNSIDFQSGSDIMNTLRKMPFIPLLDGCYGSVEDDTIWMNSDGSWNSLKAFSILFSNLRIVNPVFFVGSINENCTQFLSKVGVQRLSTHQIVKAHVLPAICDKKNMKNNDLMTEYLSFILVHLQSSCSECYNQREHIISEVYNKALILTNHGFVIPSEVPIHFGNDFGNHLDVGRFISGIDVNWHEIDKTYLKYPAGGSMLNWRKFLKELGITDFVQTVQVKKTVPNPSQMFLTNMMWEKVSIPPGSTVSDWESRELVDLLAKVSLSCDREKCKHLLEVVDEMWDDYFSNKDLAYCNMEGEIKSFRSTLVNIFNDVQWVVSSLDNELYYPKDLFHYCETVCSILGDNAPFAIPKIKSEKLVTSLGFKIMVTLNDALSVLKMWKKSAASFKASISQMSRFYSFIHNELASSNEKNLMNLISGEFVFVPSLPASSSEVVSGVLLSSHEVYWNDTMIHPECESSKMLSNLYPSLHDFFVIECGVKEKPPLLDYLMFLRHLSTVDTPLKAAKKVLDVFVIWSDGLESGLLSSEDVEILKRNLEEKGSKVFPTADDQWISLHSSYGLVCWCDDENLADEFKELKLINFFRLCELTDEEKEMLQVKVSALMKVLRIPALSEVVTREAIYYGIVDNSFETSLVSWILPYAQRYICNTYHEKYLQLKLSKFEKLNRLQIVVVEKLYYKNVIRSTNLASKKRHDCHCLLQDSTLFSTRESDSHSIFMELSRFLINGDSELHLANFLHMITTMTESGSTEEQLEGFILTKQKVPKLPEGEPLWSIQPIDPSSLNMETSSKTRATKQLIQSNSSAQSNTNWPPASWLTAPKLLSSGDNTSNIEEHVISTDEVENVERSGFSEKGQLCHGTVNMQQAYVTGRRGEQVAFNHYSKKGGMKFVKWVNEVKETGLPYDIEICDDENRKEYIEVKTTDSENKDWYEISFREWQFAVEKGECYSIARVVLSSGDKTSRVTIYKNPAKLCRNGQLKLAVLMSKQKKDEFVPC